MTEVDVKPTTWTPKQYEASKLLNSLTIKRVLLFGGSRSGKTRLIVEWIVRCCINVPGMRVLILRYRRAHAKDTVYHETLIGEVLPSYAGLWTENKSDLMIEFANGSEIWVGGTDDQARLEKMLGRGAGLVYLNEVSQISYAAFMLVRTRLSQALYYIKEHLRGGQQWQPKIVCDCNPPSPSHWTHRVFVDHIEPKDNRPLKGDEYRALRMNPADNLDNLPDSYLDELDELPQKERDRFKYGLWTKPEGAIFPEYNEDMRIDEAPPCERYYVGVDLVTYAAVLIGVQRYTKEGEERMRHKVYLVAEWQQAGALAHEANTAIQMLWGDDYTFTTIIDHNLGQAGTREFDNSKLAKKGPGSVEAGIIQMQTAMHNGEFFICRRCTVTHYELENYTRDDTGGIVKQDDHHIDATRMVLYTRIRRRKEIVAE